MALAGKLTDGSISLFCDPVVRTSGDKIQRRVELDLSRVLDDKLEALAIHMHARVYSEIKKGEDTFQDSILIMGKQTVLWRSDASSEPVSSSRILTFLFEYTIPRDAPPVLLRL
ncbi:hypothetical protein MKEN_01420700 [Mycena kentingensis (nom. inval.)]|nr:hypothetical protein MKEN_01420700 [Mycena kentingensis (nom. inval.)]